MPTPPLFGGGGMSAVPRPPRILAVPLRVRLLSAVLILVTLALVVIGVVSAVAMRRYMLDRVDGQLAETADGIDIAAVRRWGGTKVELPSDYLVAVGTSTRVPAVAAARAEADLPEMPQGADILRHANDPYTITAPTGKERWRLLIRPVDADLVLIVGESLADVDHTVDRLVAVELIVGIGVLAVLASMGVAIVQASLRPLTHIEYTAAAIAAGDLTQRVPESDPGTEFGRLAIALNAMLTQIEEAFAVRAASEERMRQFVADASHELRTPLTTIRGFAELYRQGAVTAPEETAALLKRIEDEASRMGLLVEDLLLLARLDRERPLTLDTVELRALAHDAVVAAQVVAAEREITFDAAVEPVLVLGDESRLRQVIGNLMTNALTHTPAGGPITVRVRADPAADQAVLEIVDAGPGLTEEQAERVFERFFRVDKARARQAAGRVKAVTPHSGTGLGLAIVAALVAAHRGSVGVTSVPGEGATFTVRLPLSEKTGATG